MSNYKGGHIMPRHNSDKSFKNAKPHNKDYELVAEKNYQLFSKEKHGFTLDDCLKKDIFSSEIDEVSISEDIKSKLFKLFDEGQYGVAQVVLWCKGNLIQFARVYAHANFDDGYIYRAKEAKTPDGSFDLEFYTI